jgi:uncharacterized membrane protein
MISPSLAWRFARRFAGIVFCAAGVFKIVAHAPFARFLSALHVPLPQVAALGVATLEIVGGTALLFWPREKQRLKAARVLAALLCFDMLAAIALVGAPGIAGRTQRVAGHEIGGEAWRVPLEIALLLVALGCAWRRRENGK